MTFHSNKVQTVFKSVVYTSLPLLDLTANK